MWYSVYPGHLRSTVRGELQVVHLGLLWVKQKKAPIQASWNQVFMSLQGEPHTQRREMSGPQGVGIFDCLGAPGCIHPSSVLPGAKELLGVVISWGDGPGKNVCNFSN